MKTTIQNIAGYVLGGVMFVVLLPTIMWLASGMPALEHICALRASLTGLLMVGGLTLSVWTIVYMKLRGKGNPMDAFGHEVAPRTQHLMTEGPYRINRNPMLTGTLEKRLRRDFGDEYESYCRRTGRFLPIGFNGNK